MDISRTMIQNKLEGENTTRLRAALNAGQKFVETFASNSNNVLTDFLKTGTYDKNRKFYTTTSPSMDI